MERAFILRRGGWCSEEDPIGAAITPEARAWRVHIFAHLGGEEGLPELLVLLQGADAATLVRQRREVRSVTLAVIVRADVACLAVVGHRRHLDEPSRGVQKPHEELRTLAEERRRYKEGRAIDGTAPEQAGCSIPGAYRIGEGAVLDLLAINIRWVGGANVGSQRGEAVLALDQRLAEVGEQLIHLLLALGHRGVDPTNIGAINATTKGLGGERRGQQRRGQEAGSALHDRAAAHGGSSSIRLRWRRVDEQRRKRGNG